MRKSILFVCLGNICRSPMAEEIMRSLLTENELTDSIGIDSAGILSVHQGELPDRRMREHAFTRGYRLTHRSRPVTTDDFDRFDLIIGMDDNNIDALERLAPTLEAKKKIQRMADFFTDKVQYGYVPDPYYGGSQGFNLVIDLLEDACKNLLGNIKNRKL
jgi:protein-tyrosine phosphatase